MARHETGVRRIHKTVRHLPKNKITQNKTKMPLNITTTPEVVWEKCALDIVGHLCQTLDADKYALTFQDELS
jgi:hypothetical protein